MSIAVNCKICEKEVTVPPSRAKVFKACSKKCLATYFKERAAKKYNCKCTNCKEDFYIKQSKLDKPIKMGRFCSVQCLTKFRKTYVLGTNNPNFRGRQYDQDGYKVINHRQYGREKEHIAAVKEYFGIDTIEDKYHVHHRNCDILDNTVENLALLTKSDHRWLHAQFGSASLWAYCNNKVTLENLISWSNDKGRAEKLLPLNITNQKINYG